MNTALIDERIFPIVRKYGIPAWGLSVWQEHNEVYRHVEGHRDYYGRAPATANDVYWLYSLTKLSTCTAAMQLIERGKLRLSDNVADYLPAFANVRVQDENGLRPSKTPLTVEALMTMRGGFDYDISTLKGRVGEAAQNAELINAMAELPLHFDPGTRYQYSLCHDILAGVIAAASGMPYEQWLNDELFTPLGMHETRFLAVMEPRAPFSAQYVWQNEHCVPMDMQNEFVLSPKYHSGGAGLASTLPDYVLLLDALANGGEGANGQRILQQSTVRDMATNRLTPEQVASLDEIKRGYGYGLGVRTRLKDTSNPWGIVEFGWEGAAGAYALCDTTNRVAALYVQHVRNCDPAFHVIHHAIRDALLDALA